MPTYKVTRDQAVWEREYLSVEVPDDVQQIADESDDPDSYIAEYIDEQLDAGNFETVRPPEIQDSVEGLDTVISFEVRED